VERRDAAADGVSGGGEGGGVGQSQVSSVAPVFADGAAQGHVEVGAALV